jgi:hypothetical protein
MVDLKADSKVAWMAAPLAVMTGRKKAASMAD